MGVSTTENNVIVMKFGKYCFFFTWKMIKDREKNKKEL